MSMNLYCNNIDLWQTPTYITYMSLMGPDYPLQEVTGSEAVRALRCYLEWVRSTSPSIARTDGELKVMRLSQARIKSHTEEVLKVIADDSSEALKVGCL